MSAKRAAPAATKALPPQLIEIEVDIAALGHRGDGIGQIDGRTVFVPCGAPGELALAKIVAEALTRRKKIADF